jgi:hypothetical protein
MGQKNDVWSNFFEHNFFHFHDQSMVILLVEVKKMKKMEKKEMKRN